MKQLRILFVAILLLLLLSSITQAWNPPSFNDPIRIEDVDGDPWGEGIAYSNPSQRCHSEEVIESQSNWIIKGLNTALKLVVLSNVGQVFWQEVESDSNQLENGKNTTDTTDSGRGLSSE